MQKVLSKAAYAMAIMAGNIRFALDNPGEVKRRRDWRKWTPMAMRERTMRGITIKNPKQAAQMDEMYQRWHRQAIAAGRIDAEGRSA